MGLQVLGDGIAWKYFCEGRGAASEAWGWLGGGWYPFACPVILASSQLLLTQKQLWGAVHCFAKTVPAPAIEVRGPEKWL